MVETPPQNQTGCQMCATYRQERMHAQMTLSKPHAPKSVASTV
jgi:hypothetical protein